MVMVRDWKIVNLEPNCLKSSEGDKDITGDFLPSQLISGSDIDAAYDALTKERDELVVMLRTLRLDDQQNRSWRDKFESERDRYRKALEHVEKKNDPDGREIPAWHKISIANTALKEE